MAQEFSDILQASQDFKPTGCPDRAILFRAIPMNRSELQSRPAEKLTTDPASPNFSGRKDGNLPMGRIAYQAKPCGAGG
ncbi:MULTISPECIES: hypothetical protein [unclassified Bradyrhizobium]|uniref:hypothetical protein n=1 Tax=unclassified Bradyrhizobium TaxID=2631580 RepID=UPI0023037BBA|nr:MULTISPECIES: hypothetical protein [unclassified Bradyrhizobium]